MRLTITKEGQHSQADDQQPRIDIDTNTQTIMLLASQHPPITIMLSPAEAASLAERLQKAALLIEAIQREKAEEYTYPSPQASAAYAAAKAAGASDSEAWAAAYNAAPTPYNGIAHADADDAENAWRTSQRQPAADDQATHD